MDIRLDDLRGPEIRALLDEHLRNMHEISPPESVHALDLEALRHPAITFWTAWDGKELLGCGALKELDPTHGEIKSMRTATGRRRTGVARAILERILAEARARSYARLSLETGSQPEFLPARRLYESFGFQCCAPFGDYVEDPHSVFMTRSMAVLESVLTCPHCGSTSKETMPTDACVFFHRCGQCGALLTPKAGDCCVFCSYGSVKCPPVQEARPCCTGPGTAGRSR